MANDPVEESDRNVQTSDAALGEFASWPKLDSCPECKYNLTGLPPGHACPECGWGEGHLGVYLPAWSSRSAVNRGMRNATAIALTLFGLFFTCCFAGTWWLVAGGILATILLPGRIARLLVPQRRSHDTRVIPFEDGVLICAEGWPHVYRRWRDCSRATLRPLDEHFHEIVLVRRLDVPQPDLAEVVTFEGSINAAAGVVNALNDLIRRAAPQRDVDGPTGRPAVDSR